MRHVTGMLIAGALSLTVATGAEATLLFQNDFDGTSASAASWDLPDGTGNIIAPTFDHLDATASNGVYALSVDTGTTTGAANRLVLMNSYHDASAWSLGEGDATAEQVAAAGWVFETRLRILEAGGDLTRQVATFGMRSEGGLGKTAWIGVSTTGIRFLNYGGTTSSPPLFYEGNLVDNAWHTYRLVKALDGQGQTKVFVYLDDSLIYAQDYEALASDEGNTLIQGFASMTPTTGTVAIDYISFAVYDSMDVIPEPASLALLVGGGVLLTRRRR